MSSEALLRVEINPADALQLEKLIRDAFSASREPLSPEALSYDGPAPGAFGFGEGVLEFVGKAWSDLMKVPDAVKVLAKGFSDYLRLRGNAQTMLLDVINGHVKISFKATGSAAANDPAEIAKQLARALRQTSAGV